MPTISEIYLRVYNNRKTKELTDLNQPIIYINDGKISRIVRVSNEQLD